MNPSTYQGRRVPGPCRTCLAGREHEPCPDRCGALFRFRRRRPDPDPLAQGFEAWRRGFTRDACPYVSGTREYHRWIVGHELAREEHNSGINLDSHPAAW